MKLRPVSMFRFPDPSCKTDARYTLLRYTTGSGIYMPKPRKPHSGKWVAYYRVSTDRQGKSGLGLDEAAFRRGNYGAAMRISRPLAEKGDARFQFLLAEM